MTVNEILARLKSLGDDARRAHNTKAGAPDNQFGVKLGGIRAMAKKTKIDHELALNHLPALLDRIVKEMPKAMPEVQWTMNNTLAAIGIHAPKFRKRAVAIGEEIGLYRDWLVSKACTPPYVPVWVEFMVKRQG